MKVEIKKVVRSGGWDLPQWSTYTDERNCSRAGGYRTRAELHDIVFGAMRQAPTPDEKIWEVVVNGLTYKLDYEILGVRTVTVITDWVNGWYKQK